MLEKWFRARHWRIFAFQRSVWEAYWRGESGLLHCTTGAGKTYAVWLAALGEAMRKEDAGGGLRVLWVTPLRALAADTETALATAAAELWPAWKVGRRTGDTSSYTRKKIAERPPECLVTTPESLSLLLSQPGFQWHFSKVELVVVDEWHELLSTKRGVLTELALARLRTLSPGIRTWGLSATLGNTAEAALTLGGETPMTIVTGEIPKKITIETLLPPKSEHYPWGGHLGLHLLPGVIEKLRAHATSIVFTNTRSQAELWFRGLSEAMPDWEGKLGLHHGSLDNEVRREAEQGLRDGTLRAVVATSSLDLGVDFAPVDAVLQVASPKGVARLLQRAGRSGHRPGVGSVIYCVPANTLELVEIAAARDLALAGTIESRPPLQAPLDLLCQHLATVAAGTGGFRPEVLRKEIRTTHAYKNLSNAEWDWALDFTARGGASLKAYPQFVRMTERDGVFSLRDDEITKQHRLGIGTITSDASISVQYLSGKRLGSVEESFIAKMNPGERFLFAGKTLELVRVRDLRAYVRAAGKGPKAVSRWMGGWLPISTQMSNGMRQRLDEASRGELGTPEMERLRGILEIQARLSLIPKKDELLVERLKTREGHHLFIYPFAGRLVHEGLAPLFGYRLGRMKPLTFSYVANDHGIEMLSPVEIPSMAEALAAGLFAEETLLDDILGSINAGELARRQFREIARVAGLTQEGFGRARKSARQLMVSAGLLYDVFRRYEPENKLLKQATREVLENQLEQSRLREVLGRMRGSTLREVKLESASPFSYPLMVERFRTELSSEKLSDRIARMQMVMERSVEEPSPAGKKRRYELKA